MRIDILTLFPEMCESVLAESIIGRARQEGNVEINCTQIRDYSADKHKRVDDTPYGGGMGMVMQVQPIYDCYTDLCEKLGKRPHLIFMSPQGKVLTQQRVRELSEMENIAILCGHYEGVDQRILDEIVDTEISMGDFVLTGGEIAAMAVVDATARMIPGVLACEEAFADESHFSGLLEYPQYTRPAEWHGKVVPEVLMNGNHKLINEWKRKAAIENTYRKRRGMLSKAALDKKDMEILQKLKEE